MTAETIVKQECNWLNPCRSSQGWDLSYTHFHWFSCPHEQLSKRSIPWYIFKLDQVSQVRKNQRCTVNLNMDIFIMRIWVKEGDVRTTPLARLMVSIHKWKDLIQVQRRNEEIKQLDIWIPGHPKMQINGCSHRTN